MHPSISKYLEARVPRYTSYPTAPHFSDRVGETDMRNWLGNLVPGQRLSLYLHIPFCSKMCWYCGCNMKLAARYAPIEAYVEKLLAEIRLVAEALPGRCRISHIHWGGGTPTTLSPKDLARVDDALRKHFDLEPNTEIAVEIDPRTLQEETVVALAKIGCNRASLGVQEFDLQVQQAINRIQPFEIVAQTTELLRGHGINAVNFDLMYGLPYQTAEKLLDTVSRAIALAPSRIALFGYAHVPWMAKNQRLIEIDQLPDAQARFEMAECATARIESLGYERIGIDHFALPEDSLARALHSGRLHRNFQGYTTDDADALIGFGASSISAMPQGYVQNTVETGAYMRAVGQGHLPVAKGICLKRDDMLRRTIIERLMCDFRVDLKSTCAEFSTPVSAFDEAVVNLAPFIEEGLIDFEDHRIAVAPAAYPIVRRIAATFDAYFSAGPETPIYSRL